MNIWLIGASSGIGLEVANQYAAQGCQVWMSARNEQALNHACDQQSGLHSLPMDVTNEASISQAINTLREKAMPLDKIIINSGICEYIDSYEIEREKIRNVMNTNFFGAINIAYYALPLLRDAQNHHGIQSPQLVFVSSSVTYQALPRAGAYGASKAAERYFAESLRADLVHEDIDVRVISPGFVKTPLTDLNDFPMPFLLEVDDAARRIIKGLEGKRFDIAFPKRFVWSLKLLSLLPEKLRLAIVAKTSRHEVAKAVEHV